jgi:hypothetical protein
MAGDQSQVDQTSTTNRSDCVVGSRSGVLSGGNEGLDIFRTGYPKAIPMTR